MRGVRPPLGGGCILRFSFLPHTLALPSIYLCEYQFEAKEFFFFMPFRVREDLFFIYTWAFAEGKL